MSADNLTSLITEHLDLWTGTVKTKSASGRGSSKKRELYGIKKLRELILELAVRGKLVPQDPNDEPTSVLLERIAIEKALLVKEKKIKKPKALPEIAEEEKPFELPSGWEWSRIGCLFDSIQSGGTPSKRESLFWNGNIPWASVKDLGKDRYLSQTQDYITQEGLNSGSKLANIGDILICTRMGLGKIGVVKAPMAFNQDLKGVKLNSHICCDFFINSYSTVKIKGTGTTVAGISQEQLLNYVLALPPLKEQHRIVAKVDELMALCDQLEAQTEASIDAHKILVEVLLATLVNSEDTEQLQQNWQRLSTHFDTLFTTEASIDQLKQTILQLAVMGKLVPQDPNDEPASKLLECIAAEKANLVSSKAIPKPKKFDDITEEDHIFIAPNNWVWVRLDTLFNVIVDCPHSTAKFQDDGFLCIDTNSFKQGKLHKDRFRYVSRETFEKRNARLVPMPKDIIFAREGSVGESVVIPPRIDCCLGQRVMLFRPSECLNPEFLRLTISNKGALEQLLSLHKGIGAKHVNVGDMRAFVVCLPPAKEQHRIVAKVDELMAICDQLKSKLNQSQQTQLNLTDAIVEQAV